jgi:hypothetical protein
MLGLPGDAVVEGLKELPRQVDIQFHSKASKPKKSM